MPQFLFRGVKPDGTRGHEFIQAANLDQARYTLETRGFRDIEFLSDENAELIRQTYAGSGGIDVDAVEWTAEDEAASRSRRGIWAKLWWAFKQHAPFVLPLLIWNLYSLKFHQPLRWTDWLGFGVTILYVFYFVAVVAPMLMFNQLLEASVWFDWKSVRRWIAAAKLQRRLLSFGIPELELEIRSANADAAEGNLARALQTMENARIAHKHPAPLHLARLASVYEYAGDYAAMLRCMEQAAANGSGGVTEWIDLANARLRRARDVAGAKEALGHTDGKEMPMLPKAAYDRCLGIMAVEEGRWAEAVQQLEKSVVAFKAVDGSPLIQAWVWQTQAYLTIALGALGRKDEAQKHFRPIAKWLAAGKEKDLLQRCRIALGR